MQFGAVPAGTLAPAALLLRGADHDVEYSGGTAYARALGATHLERNLGVFSNTVFMQRTRKTAEL